MAATGASYAVLGIDLALELRLRTRLATGHQPPGAVPEDVDMRIGDGGLLQIVVDAAPAAHVLAFELDGHAGAVVEVDPFDFVLFDGLRAGIAGRLYAAPPAQGPQIMEICGTRPESITF